MNDKYVKLSEVMEMLMSPRFQFLKGTDRIEKIPPKHGLCCTCQDCGRIYEDCVCTHNELIAALQNLPAVDVIQRAQVQAAVDEIDESANVHHILGFANGIIERHTGITPTEVPK